MMLLCSIVFAQDRPVQLDYQIQKKDTVSLLITVSFIGNKTGNALVHLPNKANGQHDLYKAISHFHAVSKKTFVDSTNSPDVYLIRYTPGKKIVFSYILSQAWRGPLKKSINSRLVIQNDMFYFDGYSGLVYPDAADSAHIGCKMSYAGFSNLDFKGNTFFINKDSGNFIVSYHNLMNSFFCAGKYLTKTIKTGDHQIIMAESGTQLQSGERAFSAVSKVILKQKDFNKNDVPDYYFVILLPIAKYTNYPKTAQNGLVYPETQVSVTQKFAIALTK